MKLSMTRMTALAVCVVLVMSVIAPLTTVFAGAYISWRGDSFSAGDLYFDHSLQNWKRYHDDWETISLYDTSGNRIFKGQTTGVYNLDEKGTKLIQGENARIVDQYGNTIKSFGGDFVYPCGQGFVSRYTNNGTAIYNYKGNKIVPAESGLQCYESFNKYRAMVCDYDQNYGIIDNNGKLLVPCKYTELKYISDSRIVARNRSGYYGIIDIYGNVLLPFNYTNMEYISDKRILASKIEGWPFTQYFDRIIYLDGTKRFVKPDGYSISSYISDNFIILSHIETYQQKVVNLKGETVIPRGYEAWAESDNCILVTNQSNYKIGIYNANGTKVLPSTYEALYYYSDNTLIAFDGQYYGIINAKGKVKTRCKYDSVQYLSDDCFIVQRYGKYAVVDAYGNILHDYQEDYISGIAGGNGSFAISLGHDENWNRMWRLGKIKYN